MRGVPKEAAKPQGPPVKKAPVSKPPGISASVRLHLPEGPPPRAEGPPTKADYAKTGPPPEKAPPPAESAAMGQPGDNVKVENSPLVGIWARLADAGAEVKAKPGKVSGKAPDGPEAKVASGVPKKPAGAAVRALVKGATIVASV